MYFLAHGYIKAVRGRYTREEDDTPSWNQDVSSRAGIRCANSDPEGNDKKRRVNPLRDLLYGNTLVILLRYSAEQQLTILLHLYRKCICQFHTLQQLGYLTVIMRVIYVCVSSLQKPEPTEGGLQLPPVPKQHVCHRAPE